MEAIAINANALSDDIVLMCRSDAELVFDDPDDDPDADDAELEGALLKAIRRILI